MLETNVLPFPLSRNTHDLHQTQAYLVPRQLTPTDYFLERAWNVFEGLYLKSLIIVRIIKHLILTDSMFL